MVEITFEEQNKVQKLKLRIDSETSGMISTNIGMKCTNIQIKGVPEEEGEKKGYEKFFNELKIPPTWKRK